LGAGALAAATLGDDDTDETEASLLTEEGVGDDLLSGADTGDEIDLLESGDDLGDLELDLDTTLLPTVMKKLILAVLKKA